MVAWVCRPDSASFVKLAILLVQEHSQAQEGPPPLLSFRFQRSFYLSTAPCSFAEDWETRRIRKRHSLVACHEPVRTLPSSCDLEVQLGSNGESDSEVKENVLAICYCYFVANDTQHSIGCDLRDDSSLDVVPAVMTVHCERQEA